MTGYIRTDTSNNIADGNIVNAVDLDNEFNGVEAAFNASTGHTHDGTSAEGAPITKVGPTQDVVVSATAVLPKTDGTVDLGSGSLEFKDLYIDGTANIDSLVADTADINGGTADAVTIGGTTAAAGTFTNLTASGTVTIPDNAISGDKVEGGTINAVTINTLTSGTVDINGGAVDGTSVGASTASSGAFTTLSTSSVTNLAGLTASTALALDASKNVVSVTNTGTGSNVLATSPTLITPALGTPSALVGTNITGTAAGLTAGNTTTNANLTGAVTSVGNATSLGSFTSAQLATALTDETGSGANVFATSPTLVTPALGTPSSGVVTNLTGTASININGTVGASTPAAGAFTTLSASGTSTLAAVNASGNVTRTGTGTSGGNNAGGVGVHFGSHAAGQFINFNDTTTASEVVGTIQGWNTTYNIFTSKIEFTKPGGNLGDIRFYTGTATGALALTIGGSGQNATFVGGVGIGGSAAPGSTGLAVTGAISATEIISANKGITFPATQVASADANTLDDYEEGTWTPSVGGTATYLQQVGVYTKVGDTVTIWCRLHINVIGTGSTSIITGQPFQAGAAALQYAAGAMGYFADLAIAQVSIQPVTQQQNPIIFFTAQAAAVVTTTNVPAILGSGTVVQFTITFKV